MSIVKLIHKQKEGRISLILLFYCTMMGSGADVNPNQNIFSGLMILGISFYLTSCNFLTLLSYLLNRIAKYRAYSVWSNNNTTKRIYLKFVIR